jgi:hypothetical protein
MSGKAFETYTPFNLLRKETFSEMLEILGILYTSGLLIRRPGRMVIFDFAFISTVGRSGFAIQRRDFPCSFSYFTLCRG